VAVDLRIRKDDKHEDHLHIALELLVVLLQMTRLFRGAPVCSLDAHAQHGLDFFICVHLCVCVLAIHESESSGDKCSVVTVVML
jgi:hypothetical protein